MIAPCQSGCTAVHNGPVVPAYKELRKRLFVQRPDIKHSTKAGGSSREVHCGNVSRRERVFCPLAHVLCNSPWARAWGSSLLRSIPLWSMTSGSIWHTTRSQCPERDASPQQLWESREMLGRTDNLQYNGLYHAFATQTRRSPRMRVKLQLVMCSDEGHEETITDVITLDKNNRRIEHLGLTLAEAKQVLSTLQRHVLQHQIDTFLDTCSACADCGAQLKMKAHASRSFRTLFGTFTLDSPRLEHCDCTRLSCGGQRNPRSVQVQYAV